MTSTEASFTGGIFSAFGALAGLLLGGAAGHVAGQRYGGPAAFMTGGAAVTGAVIGAAAAGALTGLWQNKKTTAALTAPSGS